MPFRVSCGPADGRTVIVSHSAGETVRLLRSLQDSGEQNIEIGHLDLGPLTIDQIEALAQAETPPSATA